ncbi:MAG: flippase-like domain-containing protein [Solirubrobacteraceae bacterium]|nr:flippase-like domain-containing protein [Solirubrobacteraceae bacterium]
MPTAEARLTWPRVERGALLLATAAMAVALVAVVVAADDLRLDLGTHAWFAAAAAYLASHMVRAIRLAYLASSPASPLRRAVAVHWYCSGISVLLPFKLGELVRIERVSRLRADVRDGIAIVWLERVLDAAAIAAAIGLVALSGLPVAGLEPVLVVTATFVVVTVLVATVLPRNIRELMLHLVRRDYGAGSLNALRVLRGALDTIDRVPKLIDRRVPSLLVMTATIWLLEFLALGLALNSLSSGFSELAGSLLRSLTGVALEAIPIQPSATDFMGELLPGVDAERIAEYRALVVGIPLVGGLLAAATAMKIGRDKA